MDRMMRVTGKGRISIAPDTIRLLITQQDVERNYEEAVRQSAERKGYLNSLLEEIGFSRADLKTLHFNVDTEYESYQAKDKSWKRRLVGYKYTHHMKLEFPSDHEKLGRVLMAVAHCPGEPEFSIEYTVKDKEAVKNDLLEKAVLDSREKAEVMAMAAGVKLINVKSIDYSWGEIDFVTRPLDEIKLSECCASTNAMGEGISMDIEADDIDVTDTVTVVWIIE